MYQKILLPLDGSRESEKIMSLIRAHMATGAEVILLKVLPYVRTQVIGEHVILGSQREEAERLEALSYLKEMASQQGGPDQWRYETVTAYSSSEGIMQFAQKEGVDVIVMYAKERKGLVKLIKGNTARAVQRDSPVKVHMFGPRDLEDQLSQEAPQATATVDMRAQESVPVSEDIHQHPVVAGSGHLASNTTLVSESDLFKDLSYNQIDRIAALGDRLSVAEGEPLGKGGELGQNVYLIVEGEAQLTTHSHLGEISVRVVGPGESFPMAALLGARTLITSGTALTDMHVLAIPSSSLIKLCSDDPQIGMHVYRLAAQLFANRYSRTLDHLATVAERQFEDPEVDWLIPH